MIEAVATDTADQAFNVRILPWRSWSRDNILNVHVLDALVEEVTVDRVTIPKQEPRRFVIREGFNDLLGCPARGWMSRDVEMGDHATVMAEHNEAEQNAKRRGRYREEVNRDDVSNMIVEKSAPSL